MFHSLGDLISRNRFGGLGNGALGVAQSMAEHHTTFGGPGRGQTLWKHGGNANENGMPLEVDTQGERGCFSLTFEPPWMWTEK